MTSQQRFTLALHATWTVLHDPILTKIYMRTWKRYITYYNFQRQSNNKPLSLYGFVFRSMHKTTYYNY